MPKGVLVQVQSRAPDLDKKKTTAELSWFFRGIGLGGGFVSPLRVVVGIAPEYRHIIFGTLSAGGSD